MILTLNRRYPTDVCDGAMIVLATYTINAFHPGRLMGDGTHWAWHAHAPLPSQLDIENGASAGGSLSEKKSATDGSH